MQGPIRAMIQEDLNKMGVVINNSSMAHKRRSKAPNMINSYNVTPGSQVL